MKFIHRGSDIEMLQLTRAALQLTYDCEYPLDSEPAPWHEPARRALILSKRHLRRAGEWNEQKASPR